MQISLWKLVCGLSNKNPDPSVSFVEKNDMLVNKTVIENYTYIEKLWIDVHQ